MSFCYSVNAGPVILAFILAWAILFTIFFMQLAILSRLNDLRRQLIDKHIIDDDKKQKQETHTPWMVKHD